VETRVLCRCHNSQTPFRSAHLLNRDSPQRPLTDYPTYYTYWHHLLIMIKNSVGSILITTLWIITITALIGGTIAHEIRLSSKAVYQIKQHPQQIADIATALAMAESHLINTQAVNHPKTPGQNRKNRLYDGTPLNINYTAIPMQAYIFSHAGKININRIKRSQLKSILTKVAIDRGISPPLSELLDSWEDWKDKDELKRLNGAESAYYQQNNPPYFSRNSYFQTPEELLLVKGFDQLFTAESLNTSFTTWGRQQKINLNYTQLETLLLLPGIQPETAKQIIIERSNKRFRSFQSLNSILPSQSLKQLRSWISFNNSPYFTISIIASTATDQLNIGSQEIVSAYSTVVRLNGKKQLPSRLWVSPHHRLPILSASQALLNNHYKPTLVTRQ